MDRKASNAMTGIESSSRGPLTVLNGSPRYEGVSVPGAHGTKTLRH